MDIAFDELPGQTKRILLNGRLDLKGSGEVDLRFTSLTTTDGHNVVVDMSGVNFIASIGMRLLLSCAKAKASRGGKMALYGLQPMVKEALETAGIDNLIPLYADEASALANLGQ
ncbi:anti-sigma factor antagonist [Parasulfuritortus cantonensis]|uniref:Anti-sigma factor antagonist n=1 Tax=Parasulfuritortus cantonensis TaxID=2528202 RepID=A0A4R1B7K1_9PROT|nr:STAS domain-containing protein [Parasulfuritortus cantonensis]TCJ11803.1 anti-sigma factor antagonist [Parasulfuritortus cantonensis]